jgi:KaiC/GvpD/RAD55 family RecA-like ATPase
MAVERVSSGIPGLDKLMQGGFVKNSVNLIAGTTGTGKTIFCTQFLLDGGRKGESGIYITLEESKESILEDLSLFEWGDEFRKYTDKHIVILDPETPIDFKELTTTSISLIKKYNVKRFVLDSLTIAGTGWKISSREDIGKTRRDAFDFMSTLRNLGVTSLLITEVPEAEDKKLGTFGFEEFVADGIVKLNYLGVGTAVYNNLEIRKMRRTHHAREIFPLEFTSEGIKVVTEKEKLHF